MAATTKIAQIIDDLHADIGAGLKVTKIKVNQATLNTMQTEFNKITASSDEVSNLLGLPIEVDSSVADGDIKYVRDYSGDSEVSVTLTVA